MVRRKPKVDCQCGCGQTFVLNSKAMKRHAKSLMKKRQRGKLSKTGKVTGI